ncbi:MAG: ClpXP protease specificity-enhancing factor [Rhodocyclaceae bacterium]|nr:ClpXP protease specificity-enhancing factor [Rhodocyclaceae bacterium]
MSAVSTKPYLIRAIYEWCLDQGFTPYLAAIVDEHTRVPAGAARDGQIVLNVSPDATHQLDMGNDFIQFQARFSGKAQMLTVPVSNVIAVYARENGHGMAFEVERGDAAEASAPLEAAEDEGAEADESVDSASPPEDAPPPPEGPAGGRAHLKLIK